MAEQGTRLIGGNLIVTTATTAQQIVTPLELTEKLTTLGAAFSGAKSVIVQALATNASAVVVGGPDVVAKIAAKGSASERKGIALLAGETFATDIDDPTKVWVDAITSKEGVNWLVLLA